ncbi:MAG TPA: arylesterase [Rhizomicrobium sp.]|jgi:acyl-CoA thioesterase-1|nr:arylesterase [Rhizomicrobium sp.]
MAFAVLLAFLGQPAMARPLKILAMGTSLTQGYGLPPGTEFTTQLQAALKAEGIDADIINAGVSGDTSADGLSRLDWSLADHPDAAILELGSNDMLRGTPPAETEKNLRAILSTLRKDHIPVLFTGMHAQRNLGADYVAQFDAIYPKLAKEFPVIYYPFILDGVALNPRLNQADGLHPNPAGVKIIVARILPDVKKLVAEAGAQTPASKAH